MNKLFVRLNQSPMRPSLFRVFSRYLEILTDFSRGLYVSNPPDVAPTVAACRPSQNSSIIFLLNAGISSGLRLVTNPLSTTTSSLTQLPPAFFMSALIAGHEVKVRPRTTPASINTHGP